MALNKAKTECILHAAATVFSNDGFSRATMDFIAKTAGVSKATLYTHFEGKEGLFSATVQAASEQFVLDMDVRTLFDMPLNKALEQVGRHYLAFIFAPDTLDFVRAVIGEAGRTPELGKQFYASGPEIGRKGILSFLKGHPAMRHLNADKIEYFASLFVTLLKHDLHFKALLGMTFSNDELEEQLNNGVTLFLSVLPD
jgi:TetR/AcrR family transcriptional repressor of mexJK operon